MILVNKSIMGCSWGVWLVDSRRWPIFLKTTIYSNFRPCIFVYLIWANFYCRHFDYPLENPDTMGCVTALQQVVFASYPLWLAKDSVSKVEKTHGMCNMQRSHCQYVTLVTNKKMSLTSLCRSARYLLILGSSQSMLDVAWMAEGDRCVKFQNS